MKRSDVIEIMALSLEIQTLSNNTDEKGYEYVCDKILCTLDKMGLGLRYDDE